jgi:release factor glutamine methyltransferase
MSQIWNIKAVLEWTQEHFAAKGVENPRLEAQWIVAAATGLSRIELYINYDQPLDQTQLATVREGIKRRLAGEPLQYITGKAPFRRLEFIVRSPVLIPRPETEVLVDVVLRELDALGACGVDSADSADNAGTATCGTATDIKIIDIGTGSGCIALSLLHEARGARLKVTATDLKAEAVTLATENAEALGLSAPLHLNILQDDLATSLLSDATNHNSFDIIVSNPPYIPTEELDKLSNEIAQYESPEALDGGADGLNTFRRIVEQAKTLLKPGGLLACELHETMLGAAKAHCEAEGFERVTVHNDLTGRPRIISAYMPT